MHKLFYSGFFMLMILFFSCSKSNEADLQNAGQGINGGTCDTADIRFSADIVPILQANCNSCHNAIISPAAINTEKYSIVKLIADNGLLVGTITHSGGYIAMPLGKPKLSSCDINKIKAWISEGAQNN